MGAGTIKVTPVGQSAQSKDGIDNLVGKLRKIRDRAAESRKFADDRIDELKKKITEDAQSEDGVDQSDVEELRSLKEKRGSKNKGYFFKQALAFEAKDRVRTSVGAFQRDPETKYDPAATADERFKAQAGLIRPGEMPDTSDREVKDAGMVGTLGKGFKLMLDAIDRIKGSISNLTSTTEKTAASVNNVDNSASTVETSVQDLDKSTSNIAETSEDEVKVHQTELDLTIDASNRKEQEEAEARSEGQVDNAGTTKVRAAGDSVAGMGGGRYNIGNIFKNVVNAVSRRRGGARGSGFSFGRSLRGRGSGINPTSRGSGINPTSSAYSSPIGPQPMNSSTPWATKGVGDRGGMFGQGGFTPRMSSTKLSDGGIIMPQKKGYTKLSGGGIVDVINRFLPPPVGPLLSMLINPMGGIGDALGGIGNAVGGAVSGVGNFIGGLFGGGPKTLTNPTDISGVGPSAVIPTNRPAGQSLMGDKSSTEDMSKLYGLPTILGGGIMLSTLGLMASKLPFFNVIAQAAKPMLKPLVTALGFPIGLLDALFVGKASASVSKNPQESDGSGDDTTTPSTPSTPSTATPSSSAASSPTAANLSGTSVVNEVSRGSLAQGLLAGVKGSGGAVGHKHVGSTSGFGFTTYHGRHHNGIDIGTSKETGYMVGFRRHGTVTYAGPKGTYGNLVIIKDDQTGTEYYFGHLKSINPDISVGTKYTGQTIGEIGKTGGGLTNGEHLHFEKRPPGSSGVDPRGDLDLLDIGRQTTGVSGTPTIAAAPNPTAAPSPANKQFAFNIPTATALTSVLNNNGSGAANQTNASGGKSGITSTNIWSAYAGSNLKTGLGMDSWYAGSGGTS